MTKLITCCVFLALSVISPILGQPWTGSPWIPAPNVQQDWMAWNWMERFQQNVEFSRTNGSNINVLFYGDSIVEGWGWNTALWERSFGHRGAANYGIGGDGTQNVLWRIINGEVDNISPRIIVLMIGMSKYYITIERYLLSSRSFKVQTTLDRFLKLTWHVALRQLWTNFGVAFPIREFCS